MSLSYVPLKQQADKSSAQELFVPAGSVLGGHHHHGGGYGGYRYGGFGGKGKNKGYGYGGGWGHKGHKYK